MCQTVFTQYDPLESWYTKQKDAWLDDIKIFLSSTDALFDHCSSFFFLCTGRHNVVGGVCLSLARKNMHRRFTAFSRRVQACDIEQVTEERNIQQCSIHPRNESSHVEFVDKHYPARSNDCVRGDSSD